MLATVCNERVGVCVGEGGEEARGGIMGAGLVGSKRKGQDPVLVLDANLVPQEPGLLRFAPLFEVTQIQVAQVGLKWLSPR